MTTQVFEERKLIRVFSERTNSDGTLCSPNCQPSIENSNIPKNDTKNNGIAPHGFANYLLNSHRLIKINSVLYIYNNVFGYYQPLTVTSGDLLIRQITPPNLCNWVSSHNIKETIYWLNSMVDEQASPEALYYSSHRHLNFMDGYLDVIDNQFHSHDPKMIFTSYIPFTYSECCAAKESPVFDDWIDEITNSKENFKISLAQIFGYLISEYRNMKYIFILYGPSNTGKSVWLNLTRAAIGENFVKSISLHNLTTNFRPSELVGMKANICAEIDHRKITNIDIIKSLVGGSDKINADVKNGKPIEFVNTAALVFSANSLDWLRVADPGNALTNRLCIIPFKNIIEQNSIDNNFFHKLFKELPSILYKFAIPGFGYLATNNFQFDLEATNQLKNPAKEAMAIAISFLKDACIFHGSVKIHTERIYSTYLNYCNYTTLPVIKKLEFKDLLNNLHHHLDIAPLNYCEKFRDEGFNRNGFLGITLREDFRYI